MAYATNNSVLFNVDQNYPETSQNGASKQRARNNIGAASATDLTTETARATAAEKAAKTEVSAGTGISVTSSTGANGQTIYTVGQNNIIQGTSVVLQNNSPAGTVTTPVSTLAIDTDFLSVSADGNEVGVIAPPPYTPNTPKVLGVSAGSDIPAWVDPSQGVAIINVNTSDPSAQDTVYANIENAINNGLEPILRSNAGLGVIYWTLQGYSSSTGYDFGHNSSTYVQRLNISANAHKVTTSTIPFVPGLRNMTRQDVSIDSNFSGTLTLYNNVAYVCTVTDGSLITLATDSTLDIHCKIYLQNDTTWSSCPTVTVQWRDEARYVSEIDYTWYDYQHVRRYGLDIIGKKVVVSEAPDPYLEQSMFRVTEYPCASHVDLDDSETKYIGQQAYYEPL